MRSSVRPAAFCDTCARPSATTWATSGPPRNHRRPSAFGSSVRERRGTVRCVAHELVASVRLGDGSSLAVDEIAAEGFAVSALPDRDPTVAAFLISFAASASLELLLAALRRVVGSRPITLAMKRNNRRLTIDTNDDGLDVGLLSRVVKDFYRDDD